MVGLRLNLGCGLRRFDGFINVDRFGEPDLQHDLEVFPWPWPDDSVVEVAMLHVLEHLGQDPNVFLGIMKELYRVCRDEATIRIAVPHHRHDFFYGDPTHVRAITGSTMALFSQRMNRQWAAEGMANSPLGLYLGIDFEMVSVNRTPSALWRQLHQQDPAAAERLLQSADLYNNVIEQLDILLQVIKPAGRTSS